jgi:hypothetical protein
VQRQQRAAELNALQHTSQRTAPRASDPKLPVLLCLGQGIDLTALRSGSMALMLWH